jgi:glycerol-3-phosphate cytidylyltransferase
MSNKKYRIGYTTGVFDMFHIGHLNILKRAKEQCDFLIVGVSTDDLVRNYKNKTPIISFEERCLIIEAIKYVDKVVPQENMNKVAAVERLGADVVFVGSDWKGTAEWNEYERLFSKFNCSVVYLDHTDGISSTILCEKLKKENKE